MEQAFSRCSNEPSDTVNSDCALRLRCRGRPIFMHSVKPHPCRGMAIENSLAVGLSEAITH